MSTTPKKAPIVFRLSGILPHTSQDDVISTLRGFLSPDESDTEFLLELMPDPSHDAFREEQNCIALISFKPAPPAFLGPLFKGRENLQFETALGDLNFDKHFFGLTQLYNTEEGREVKADIVCVTGLDGHAYGSFRGRGDLGRMWLRDFFKKDFPECRTLIWGYNSKLNDESSVHKISDYNTLFLRDLNDARRDKKVGCGCPELGKGIY